VLSVQSALQRGLSVECSNENEFALCRDNHLLYHADLSGSDRQAMTNGTTAPSAIHGDTYEYPSYGGIPLSIAIPYMASSPNYSDLPYYWSWARDVALAATVHREDMWAAAVSRTATKFAAHGFTIRDSRDSKRKVAAAQALLKEADGSVGWVVFATKVMQDLLTTDNGIFIRLRRADDEIETIKLKAYVPPFGGSAQTFDEVRITRSSPAAKITGLYHLDSLRCVRTGNLAYPVRYQPLMGSPQLLRWDQVLCYADQTSPRAEMLGVGYSAASRSYKTISKLAALEQLVYEFIAGKGANKISFVQGISEPTLNSVIKAGEQSAIAKGLIYYLGTIVGAIPGDTPLSLTEILLKQLPQGFEPKQIQDNAYLIYANNIGIPVQDIQPLSGQGLGTGTQTVILQEAAQGIGALPAFLKWWEQTFSDRVLPATTELSFDDDNDVRDQKARADVALVRAQMRAARIASGEITPAVARQLAADSEDLPQELLAADATPGGQISDDEKPVSGDQINQQALDLMQSLPTSAPSQQPTMAKSYDPLFAAELAIARKLAKWSEE